jgi:hypothetical protein
LLKSSSLNEAAEKVKSGRLVGVKGRLAEAMIKNL